jgi:hypothetical protein
MTRATFAILTSVFVLTAAWMASGFVSSSSAAVCVPRGAGQPDYCPGADPPPPPPPEPDCPLDPPPGLICKPGPSVLYEYEGAAANGTTTNCAVWLYGATPPDQNGGEEIQFRGRARCNQAMRNISVDTRLLGPLLGPIASGPTGYCHEFSGAGCPASLLVGSTGGISGRGAGEYTLVVTVRLALREGTLDPWVVTPGVTPPGSAEACKPGTYVTRCELRLVIPADGL